MKDQVFFETDVMPFPYYNLKGYKIQLDFRVKNNPMQRHIYYGEGLIDVEEWIPTPSTGTDGFKAVEKLDPSAETEFQIIRTSLNTQKPGTQLSLI
jgi:hypothetical protein